MLHCGDYDMKKRSKAKKPIRGIYKAMESEFKAARKRRKKRAASKPSAKKGDVRRSVGKKHARNPKKSRRGVRGR